MPTPSEAEPEGQSDIQKLIFSSCSEENPSNSPKNYHKIDVASWNPCSSDCMTASSTATYPQALRNSLWRLPLGSSLGYRHIRGPLSLSVSPPAPSRLHMHPHPAHSCPTNSPSPGPSPTTSPGAVGQGPPLGSHQYQLVSKFSHWELGLESNPWLHHESPWLIKHGSSSPALFERGFRKCNKLFCC